MKNHKYTLQETWDLCLKMWRWIADYYMPGDSIVQLKRQWLKLHGLGEAGITESCFFCHSTAVCPGAKQDCNVCPGKAADPSFSCMTRRYHYYNEPKKFYREIARLHKIWLKTGGGPCNGMGN